MPVSNSFRAHALAALLGLSAIGTPGHAAQTVLWSQVAWTPAGTVATAMIGAPDLVHQVDAGTASKFDLRVDYPTLAAAMGLSAAQFARYDLIAWEGNGGSPGGSGGWESVSFVFDDLRTAVGARYDEVDDTSSNPAVQFLTGSISGAAYDALFGTRGAQPVMSWLLVDVPDSVDVRSAGFRVRFEPGGLSAGGRGEGSPELDAIGLVASVPEPGSAALIALALAGCWALRRRVR